MARKKTSKPKDDAAKTSIPKVDEDEENILESTTDLPDEQASDPPQIEERSPEEPSSNDDVEKESTTESETDDLESSVEDAEPETEQIDTVAESAETSVSGLTEPSQPEIVPTETVAEQKSGFFPLVLGGVVAAGVGFAAAHFSMPQQSEEPLKALEKSVSEQLSEQSEKIGELTNQIGQSQADVDLKALSSEQIRLSALVATLAESIESGSNQLNDFELRLSDLEKRPITEGVSDEAVAAYENELKALQEAMAAQRAEIEEMTSEALSLEENAEEIARSTMQRAALTRIQTALDSGSAFASALADIEESGVPIPDTLAGIAAEGAPTLADLQAAFPMVARAALAASRQEAAEANESGGFGAFLKTQLGARSLEPREGDDPDAVLSRAEAAIREGRLRDALAEIEGLPEVGRIEIEDWAAKADARLDALAAVETLGQELN